MFFAQLHPMLVHFPVGLLVSGVVFEFYGSFQQEESAKEAGRFNIRFGTCVALFVAGVGLLALWGLELKGDTRQYVGYHLMLALATIVIFGFAIGVTRWFRHHRWCRTLYLGLILVGLASVMSTGYFGGELVHRFGVATLQPVE